MYQRQILQVKTRLNALDEIYKIYTLFKISLCFRNCCPKLTDFDEEFRNFNNCHGKDQNILDPQIS